MTVDVIERDTLSQAEMVEMARFVLYDNQCEGDPGFCEPDEAVWTHESLAPDRLRDLFDSDQAAATWFANEMAMDEEESLCRDWRALLTEPIREAVVLFVRDGRVHLWDGWHRTAASIVTGRPLVAIVGRPKAN